MATLRCCCMVVFICRDGGEARRWRGSALAVLSEGILLVTETTAQAVYMIAEKTPGCKKAVPGAIDGYLLARARLAR